MALTVQAVGGPVVVAATLLQPNPLDGWDVAGALAFGILGILALRELTKSEPRGGGDPAR